MYNDLNPFMDRVRRQEKTCRAVPRNLSIQIFIYIYNRLSVSGFYPRIHRSEATVTSASS